MKPRPIEIVDEGGRALVRVPLGCKNAYEKLRYAEIWKDDHDFLMKLGVSPNWLGYRVKNKFYVSAGIHDGGAFRVLIARVLLDAGAGQVVRYVDGNSLNLRRENLKLAAHKNGKLRARNFEYARSVLDNFLKA